ncbi:MAG: hypothetical protein FJ278_05460 [Planctomycetes bacterium]|nr:hypothetical protein [Planctomycetota bacterium]
MRKVRYEEMTFVEAQAALVERPLVYVPIGSLEFHGCHLPLGLDTLHAYRFCLAAAQRTAGVVLPPTFWGTRGHEKYEGSVLLEDATIATLMRNVLERLGGLGYRLIVVTTGHYPQVQGALLKRVADEYMATPSAARVLVLDPFTCQPMTPQVDHGGRIETSLMLHLHPELVDMARLRTQPNPFRGVKPDCVEGTAEEGRERFQAALDSFVQAVEKELASTAGRENRS